MLKRLLCLGITLSFIGASAQKPFKINQKGEVVGEGMKALIKQRGYQAVSAFDTVWKSPALVYAIYLRNNKMGILDIKGKEVTPAKYDDIPGMNRSYTNNMFGFHETLIVRIGDKEGVITNQGKELIPPVYDNIDYSTPSRKKTSWGQHRDSLYTATGGGYMYQVTSKNEILGKEEMINLSVTDMPGSIDMMPVVEDAGPYNSYRRGAIGSHTINSRRESSKQYYGVLNHKNGEQVIPTNYDYVQVDQFGNYLLTRDRKSGLADTSGKMLVPVDYDVIYPSGANYFLQKEGKYALYSKNAESLTGFVFDQTPSYADKDIFSISKNGKYGVIARNGKELIPFIYDELHFTTDCHYPAPFITATLNGKKGFIDISGKVLVPFEYEKLIPECRVESEGPIAQAYFYSNTTNSYYFFQKDRKYGILGKKFEVIVPNMYDWIEKSMHKNVVYVGKKNEAQQIKRGLLNVANNKVVVPLEFDWINYHHGGYHHYDRYFSGGYYSVGANEKTAVYDQDGKLWLQMPKTKSLYIDDIYNGLIKVRRTEKTFYVDYNGNQTN